MHHPNCLEGEMSADEDDVPRGETPSCWDPSWCVCVANVETERNQDSIIGA